MHAVRIFTVVSFCLAAPTATAAPGDAAPTEKAAPSVAPKLPQLKWSGFVQGRGEWHQDSQAGVDAQGKPLDGRYFRVRTARLKVVHQGALSEMVLQVEAAGDSVALRDAEATFVEPWSPARLRLTVGQFTWPFGHELQQSPADFVLPERSLVVRKLFPGERDRGLRLQARYAWLRFSGAIVNGNGIQDPIYRQNDQNSFKDLVARVGGELGTYTFGISGYWGRARRTTLGSAATVTGADVNGDGVISGDELTYKAPTATTYDRFWTYRVGADVQGRLSVGRFGQLTLKGEMIWARDVNAGSGDTPPSSAKNRTMWGWYALAGWDMAARAGVAVRVDQYDPGQSSGAGRVTTLGGSVLGYISPELKLLLAYEHVMEQRSGVGNDVATAQLQARF